MARKKFKIISEPQSPVRKENVKVSIELCEYNSLKGLEDWANKYSLSMSDISIQKEYGYYNELELYACATIQEPQSDFKDRVNTYKKKKATYDAWYKTNKEKIKAELSLRKKEEAQKNKNAEEARRKQLKKELDRLNKKLGR